jgi:hypothetical protein
MVAALCCLTQAAGSAMGYVVFVEGAATFLTLVVYMVFARKERLSLRDLGKMVLAQISGDDKDDDKGDAESKATAKEGGGRRKTEEAFWDDGATGAHGKATATTGDCRGAAGVCAMPHRPTWRPLLPCSEPMPASPPSGGMPPTTLAAAHAGVEGVRLQLANATYHRADSASSALFSNPLWQDPPGSPQVSRHGSATDSPVAGAAAELRGQAGLQPL